MSIDTAAIRAEYGIAGYVPEDDREVHDLARALDEVDALRADVEGFKEFVSDLQDGEDRIWEECKALRAQRDHLYRLLERIYAWGGLTGTGDPDATPVDDLSEGAVEGTELGRFLYNPPPTGPAWPTPMDDEPNPAGEE